MNTGRSTSRLSDQGKARVLSESIAALTGHAVDIDIDQWQRGVASLAEEQMAYAEQLKSPTDALAMFCTQNSVPFLMGRELRSVASELAAFQRENTSRVRTLRQRMKALDALEAHARAMLELLAAMPVHSERFHLEVSLRDAGWSVPDQGGIPTPGDDGSLGRGEPRRVNAASNVLTRLAVGAKRARDVVGDDGRKGGRRETVAEYAYFVFLIALETRDVGYSPGRGGPFERLCGAIFETANVPASPDAAIRYFAEHYRGCFDELSKLGDAAVDGEN